MNKPTVGRFMSVVVLVLVVVIAACNKPAETPVEETQVDVATVEVATGETLLTQRCINCHDLERTTGKTKTRDDWTQIVTRMVQKGAELTAEEQAVLIDYLVAEYGPVTQ